MNDQLLTDVFLQCQQRNLSGKSDPARSFGGLYPDEVPTVTPQYDVHRLNAAPPDVRRVLTFLSYNPFRRHGDDRRDANV